MNYVTMWASDARRRRLGEGERVASHPPLSLRDRAPRGSEPTGAMGIPPASIARRAHRRESLALRRAARMDEWRHTGIRIP